MEGSGSYWGFGICIRNGDIVFYGLFIDVRLNCERDGAVGGCEFGQTGGSTQIAKCNSGAR